MKHIRLGELFLPVALSICLVVLVDLFTNTLDIQKYRWDFRCYIAMAEQGFKIEHAIAPSAYRFGATLPAYLMNLLFGIPVGLGFKLVAYLGAWATLFLVYLFMRLNGFSRIAGLLGIIVVGVSVYHIKFLQFDVFRPDHLAYPMMLLAMIFLLRRKWQLVLIVCVVGLQVREFLIVPLLILLGQEIATVFSRSSERGPASLRMIVVVCGMLLAVLVPRILIPIEVSFQQIDPLNKPYSLMNLLFDPLDLRKDVNYVLSFLTYMLPSILLMTPRRLERIWFAVSRKERRVLCAYTALVLILALYGGTDYGRFMSYLFIPQVFLLGLLLDNKPHVAEVLYMLAVVVLVNKVFLPVPIWDLNSYLDWLGGWGNRINLMTFHKFAYLIIAFVGAVTIRELLIQAE